MVEASCCLASFRFVVPYAGVAFVHPDAQLLAFHAPRKNLGLFQAYHLMSKRWCAVSYDSYVISYFSVLVSVCQVGLLYIKLLFFTDFTFLSKREPPAATHSAQTRQASLSEDEPPYPSQPPSSAKTQVAVSAPKVSRPLSNEPKQLCNKISDTPLLCCTAD